MSEKPAPFTNPRNKLTIYKITIIYAAFYFLMKIYAIINGSWFLPNIIISLPMVLIGILAWWQLKQEKTNWWFIAISIIVVSAVRYYELPMAYWLNQNL
jgi:drug/metabolite transporter (DMT)-like permease